MLSSSSFGLPSVGLLIGVVLMVGCQEQHTAAVNTAETSSSATSSAVSDPADEASEYRQPVVSRPKRSGPIQLSGITAAAADQRQAGASAESVLAALQPLQVLLGKWTGTSRKAIVDQPQWVWDFQTDPQQPALVLKSDKGEFLREARLTYLPLSEVFQLTTVDDESRRRVLQGKFIEPVQDVAGDDDQLQRTFKLELTERKPLTAGEVWQIVFAQQENDRYIVEVNRKRGSGPFARLDTIHTQREGTSFAVSSTDYGEKTCIISQGLGTIPVSFQGKSYWVCCTGCKAAFEEDPEKWIAKYEEKKSMKR